MKKSISFLILIVCMLLSACAGETQAQIAATTLPVYEFTAAICQGTDLTVTRLVNEEVSCLHDYSLNVRQVKAAEAAQIIVISGAGLEDFMMDLLPEEKCIDASRGISLLCSGHSHEQAHDHASGHSHDSDPHIWLDPANAMIMARNICTGLSQQYPYYQTIFEANLELLLQELEALQQYGAEQLRDLSCRELVTFHDGFAYLAQAYDLTILEALEEESGSEASAEDLIHLINLVENHGLPAVFTEKNGSTAAAGVISQKTGAAVFSLDMAMSGSSYFDAMRSNFDTLKEALG